MKVVFFGGRQALRLALAYVRHLDDAEGVQWIADHSYPSGPVAQALREADKIVWIDGGASMLNASDLEIEGEIIHLPELQLECLWPFGGQPHIANVGDEFYPDGPFPAEIGDAWLNRALEGLSRPEAAEAAYLALDVARVVDLDRMRDLSLARQAERDQLFGVAFAPLIAEGFRTPTLFWGPRTPGPKLFGALAQAAFARLGLVYSGAVESGPPFREPPIHPSVVRHFGLEGERGRVDSAAWGGPVDFTEYVRRYLAFAEGPELERGLALIVEGRGAEAADALEIAAARPMGRRSTTAQRALAHACVLAVSDESRRADLRAFAHADIEDLDVLAALAAFARGRLQASERRLIAYMARAPDRSETVALLATIRELRGDAEGAFAALELAVGMDPRDSRLLGRYAQALAARGDVWGAVRAVEAEIALDPKNPRPHAALGRLLLQAGWRDRAKAARDRAFLVVGDAAETAALAG